MLENMLENSQDGGHRQVRAKVVLAIFLAFLARLHGILTREFCSSHLSFKKT